MIFVASSHERISGYRGQSQTSPPAAWRKPSPRRIGGGQVNGYGNRAGIGYPCILHGIDGDSCRCGGQERPGMVRARGYAQRTRSPRSRRKNGASLHPPDWGRGTPTGSGIRRPAGRGLVEPAAEPNREGRETGLQAPIAAKEGGTAGQPPASLVPPAKPYRQGPRDRGPGGRQPGRGRPPCRAQTRPRQASASPSLLQRPPRPKTSRRRRCRSPNCLRSSTCPRSSARSSPAGVTAGCSSGLWTRRRPGSHGRSTRARRPRTACPACTTSRRGYSRTCSRGSRPCRASTCHGRVAGTATACR